MRQAGTLPPDADAERFADYLLTLGIKSRIDSAEHGRIVWIKDEQDIERGKAELAAFVANQADPKYRLAEEGARTIRKELEAKEQQFRKNIVNVRSQWAQPLSGRARVTFSLIVLSIVVTALQIVPSTHAAIDDWLRFTSLARIMGGAPIGVPPLGLPPELMHAQVWRLVTPIFIHGGLLHILFNMFMLQNMGTLIETREGTRRMLLLVLLSAVISNLGEYYSGSVFQFKFLMSPSLEEITKTPMFGGMSGVNYALFGYLWLRSLGGRAGFMLHPNTVFIMLAWLVVCMTGLLGNVANGAHVFGLAVGMFAGRMADEVR